MVSAELFQILNTNWGPFTVDRFASELNKNVSVLTWLPGTEAVDALNMSWRSEFNWLVPPTYPMILYITILNSILAKVPNVHQAEQREILEGLI